MLVRLARQARKVFKAYKVMLVLPGLLVHKATSAPPARRAHKVFRATLAPQVRKAFKAFKVTSVRLVPQEIRVQ